MNPQYDYEKLDTFYLGRELDPETEELAPHPLLYKDKYLTTHGAIIGMTGSGKTGLGIGIIEEAVMDNIPVLVIDPKGDMGNLMLAFPKLTAKDFLPWIDPAQAASKGLSPEDLAKKTAKTWRDGLKTWWQGPDRISKYVSKAERRIYTPGSTAGIPISMLGSFSPPEKALMEDTDMLISLINSTVTGLLSLAGINAEPLRSREHLILSTIFLHFWRRQQNLTMESLIGSLINPPFKKLGVMPVETLYPSKDRMALAMTFNTILASPQFATWLEGDPLDIRTLLYTPDGRPRISIFTIAHLSESERMFFVTILLNRFLNWLKMQQGSSSLRCLLYMDEIAGYFPPSANPPSKRPMLLLLKQARAFGAGIILSTQNPVDLDYKGLSNIGTWFIGRLQTRQDQDRVLDGLKSASGGDIDTAHLRKTLSSLPKRTFLLRSVHLDSQRLFQTRWVMSYLRGPLTLDNIRTLTASLKAPTPQPTPETHAEPSLASAFPQIVSEDITETPPILSGQIPQRFFIPPLATEHFILKPSLAVTGKVRFFNSSRGIDIIQEHSAVLPLDEDFEIPVWENIDSLEIDPEDLSTQAPSGASYLPLPTSVAAAKSLKPFLKSWKAHLYQTQRLELFRVKALKIESQPGQPREDFVRQVSELLKERKAEALERLERKYERRYRSLENKLIKAQNRLEKEERDVSTKGMDTAVNFGVAILGALFGRKTFSSNTATRTGRGIRSASRMLKEREDVKRAREEVQRLQDALSDLARELDEETARLSEEFSLDRFPIESFFIKPRKTDIFDTKGFILWEATPDLSK